MITRYNLDFDIAAVVILLLEVIYVRVQYSHDKYSSRLFTMLLHSSLLLAIVDIVSSLMLAGEMRWASRGLVKFTCSFYYFVTAFTIMVFYRYIVEYLGISLERTVSYFIMTYFPLFFVIECLIANCFANILFTGGKYGYFSYGPLIWIIYYYPVYYFVLTIIRLIRARKSITVKQCLPVMAYMVATLIAVAIQYIFQDVMMMSFGFAIALFIMMMSLETPDYKKLVKTTELLEAVRGDIDYQSKMNEALISEMSKEICSPVEKLLEKSNSCDENETADYVELREYVNGYGKIVSSVIGNANEFLSPGDFKKEIKTEEYSVREFVNSIGEIMLPAAKDAADSISVDIDPYIPDMLLGEPEMLRQIMINLVSESIEKTHDGLITIGVNGRKIESDSINLILSVSDNGEGMRRDTVRKLLQFNTKSSKWNNEVFDGGYFKIRIAKRMIERMHGKLHIDSDVNKGTKYMVVLSQGLVHQPGR